MSQTGETQPEEPFKPLLEFIPHQSEEFGESLCATCCQRYLGALTEMPDVVAHIRELIKHASEKKIKTVNYQLPNLPEYRLRRAVTVAPSVYFAYPAPVCWVHMIPHTSQMQIPAEQAVRSPIIPGKSNNWKGNLS